MTRDEAAYRKAKREAKQVIERHQRGEPVTAMELREATHIVQNKRNRRMTLPEIPRPVKERINALLLFRLGLAIGKSSPYV